MIARRATQTKTKLNMLLFGDTFTGKTTLASQLAYFKREDGKPFRVLYIDAETGGLDSYLDDMEASGVNLNNIYIVYTQSLAEVKQLIEKVRNREDFYEYDENGNETVDIVLDADGEPFRPDALIVDGVTILNLTTQNGLLEFSKKRNKVKADKDGLIGDERLIKIEGASLEIKDWGTIKYRGQSLILDLMACGVHCIVTAREEDEKVSIKTDSGQIASVTTGNKKPSGFKDLEYNTNTVIRTFLDKETNQICAQIIKDRTKVHSAGEIIEDPTLLDWQVAIDKTKDKKDFVLKNDLDNAIEVEQKLYEKELLGKDTPILNNSISSTNDADTLRAEITEFIKSLTPPQKTEMKKKLTDAGLPTAFKSVTDAATLQKVLDTIKAQK